MSGTNKGQIFLVSAMILALVFLFFRPENLIVVGFESGESLVVDNLKNEFGHALSVSYFNSTEPERYLYTYLDSERILLKSQDMDLEGFGFIFTPERRWGLVNIYGSNITGTVTIGSDNFDINIGRDVYNSTFSSFGTVSINITTPNGIVERTFEIDERLSGYANLWVKDSMDVHLEILV
ncbi:MAG: hypothetical protein DRP11_03690 [Candidatus Aenigmatarchaeota archaeon]|nr:MAG: hypothetical protein DRP11_03690 [Candidatus Aenigmarchaeota archaeon]